MNSGDRAGRYVEGTPEGRTSDGQRRGLRPADQPVPAGAAGALLPDARLGARGRGPGAGDAAAGLAGLRPVRPGAGRRCAPGCTGSPPTPASPRCAAGPGGHCRRTSSRPNRRPGRPHGGGRGALVAARPRRAARPGHRRRGPGRACGWRWSPRCNCCRPGSGPSCSCARCSDRPAAEVAEALATTPAAVNSGLQRARARLGGVAVPEDQVASRPTRTGGRWSTGTWPRSSGPTSTR